MLYSLSELMRHRESLSQSSGIATNNHASIDECIRCALLKHRMQQDGHFEGVINICSIIIIILCFLTRGTLYDPSELQKLRDNDARIIHLLILLLLLVLLLKLLLLKLKLLLLLACSEVLTIPSGTE